MGEKRTELAEVVEPAETARGRRAEGRHLLADRGPAGAV